MNGYEKRWFAVARTASKPENMQGFHEDNMLFYPKYRGRIYVNIDDTGLGGCVTDRLAEVKREQHLSRMEIIPVKPGFLQWIKDEVIPGARAEGVPAKPATRPGPGPERHPAVPDPIHAAGNVAQRIDEIIFELMLLKKTLA